jgi:hypothetical protein
MDTLKRLQSALSAGVSAFIGEWREYGEARERVIAERYIEKTQQRDAVVQNAFATLSATDQHFMMHFTDTLDPEQRPDHAAVKRILEMVAPWSTEAKKLLAKELVGRCANILIVPAFSKWAMSLPRK